MPKAARRRVSRLIAGAICLLPAASLAQVTETSAFQISEGAACFSGAHADLPAPDWTNTNIVWDWIGLVEILPGAEIGQYFLRVMRAEGECLYLAEPNQQVVRFREQLVTPTPSMWFGGTVAAGNITVAVLEAICDRASGIPASVIWTREDLHDAAVQTRSCAEGAVFNMVGAGDVYMSSGPPDASHVHLLFLVHRDFLVLVSP